MIPYAVGNKYSPFISFVDAVLLWTGTMPAEFPFVFLNAKGLPTHLDSRDLLKKAEWLLLFIERKCIQGITHTENGDLLPCSHIKLERDSFFNWRCERASI